MSKFIYHIHYQPCYKMHKLDGLSTRSGEEKSKIKADSFNEEQLTDFNNEDIREEEAAEDVELEEINMVI